MNINKELQKYIDNSKSYPVPSLEEFCNKQSILLNELYKMASNSDELNDTIQYFKQKQKALIMQLLTIKGNITLKDKDGNKQTITLDKKGVCILAKHLGIV